MEKKYQVFVSSTFEDLKNERQEIIQAILELRAIPVGMELFPAANEEQWSLIKRSIDDCDYYILVIAGRYGSLGPEGLSFTEMEYRYAIEQGKPVIGFVHENPGTLPSNRCEQDHESKAKLEDFRSLVQSRMCKKWSTPSDLGGKVSRSLVNLINDFPAVGWVRGDLVASESLLVEINNLRKESSELKEKINILERQVQPTVENLAPLDQNHTIKFTGTLQEGTRTLIFKWSDIFKYISPALMTPLHYITTKKKTEEALNFCIGRNKELKFQIDENDIETILLQFKAYGLIVMKSLGLKTGGSAIFCWLTPSGERTMLELRTIKAG